MGCFLQPGQTLRPSTGMISVAGKPGVWQRLRERRGSDRSLDTHPGPEPKGHRGPDSTGG